MHSLFKVCKKKNGDEINENKNKNKNKKLWWWY